MIPPTPTFSSPNRGRWPALACLVAFVVIVHLSLMAASLTCGTSAPPAVSHCTETCPTSVTRACTVVEQAVEPVPLMPLVLIALLALSMVALCRKAVTPSPVDWLWHPQRCRAFLQVFLR
ncbi:MAG: hypothetical protein M3176_08490 [Chloroflexota bacterium]|nr:hypothetical protein [Chloroflexota bacterium]